MKCWKCQAELAPGDAFCSACGASQNRPAPATEQGRALRAAAARIGLSAMLSDPERPGRELALRMDGQDRLCRQLRLAMLSGVGTLCLTQLSRGAPEEDFYRRLHALLCVDAGLREEDAAALAVCLCDMIGWPAPAGEPERACAPSPAASPSVPASEAARPLFPGELAALLSALFWALLLGAAAAGMLDGPVVSEWIGDNIQYLMLVSVLIPALLSFVPAPETALGKKAPPLAWAAAGIALLALSFFLYISYLAGTEGEKTLETVCYTGAALSLTLCVQLFRRLTGKKQSR